jgi:hypothetical protein
MSAVSHIDINCPSKTAHYADSGYYMLINVPSSAW